MYNVSIIAIISVPYFLTKISKYSIFLLADSRFCIISSNFHSDQAFALFFALFFSLIFFHYYSVFALFLSSKLLILLIKERYDLSSCLLKCCSSFFWNGFDCLANSTNIFKFGERSFCSVLHKYKQWNFNFWKRVGCQRFLIEQPT